MLVARRPYTGLGSTAPALQLPRVGSNISVESSLTDPVHPPLTRSICNNEALKYRICTRYLLSDPPCSRHVTGAGVVPSPNVETWEILQPSLNTVHDHCGVSAITPRDHHSVHVRVRDGTGVSVMKNVTNLIIKPLSNSAFSTYSASCLSEKTPGSCVPSGLIRVDVLLLSS